MSVHDFIQKPLKIDAIFILDDLTFWEKHFKVFHDIAKEYYSHPDYVNEMPLDELYGYYLDEEQQQQEQPQQPIVQKKVKQFPVYAVHQDVVYPDKFSLPRLSLGTFLKILDTQIDKENGKKLYDIHISGKPDKMAFQYAEYWCKNYWKKYEVSQFYMIGDSLKSDIETASELGWVTILVKTGLYKESKQKTFADYVVDDFFQAINLICGLEKIPLKY